MMRLMNPGGMTRRVSIHRPAGTKDAAGSPQSTWPVFASGVWAKREDLSGREIWQAQQVTAKIPVRYRIWYLAGLTTAMRLVDGGRTFNITSIADPDGHGREMVLLCEEVSSDA